jgi:hypothetical protein
MKGRRIVYLLCILLFTGSCCSKKGACPALKFDSFELIDFNQDDVTEVHMIRYIANTNFITVLDSTTLYAEPAGTNTFRLKAQALSIDYDYGIYSVPLNKLYRISRFTGEKIICGKCFMKQNNQFGYELNGYSVNNVPKEYDGTVRIKK